jgi:hypothetical protein
MLGKAQGVKELAGLKDSRKSDPGSYVFDGEAWVYWHPRSGRPAGSGRSSTG